MSGLRSTPAGGGSKAAGEGSTHRSNATPLAGSGAKATQASGGGTTHASLSPDRREKAGAKASNSGRNTTVAAGQDVSERHGRAAEQTLAKGKAVQHYHGTEHVSEHHRR
jgi:hypothetical protein